MKTLNLRNLTLFLSLAALLTAISGCDKIKEALKLEAPFSEHLYIDVSNPNDLTYYEIKTYDLSENEDFQKNKDKIDQFSIKEVYYKVVDYTGAEGIKGSGTIKFSNDGGQIGDVISQSDIDFNDLYTNDKKVVISISDNTKNKLSDALKNGMKFNVIIEGAVTDHPVYADVEFFVVIEAKLK